MHLYAYDVAQLFGWCFRYAFSKSACPGDNGTFIELNSMNILLFVDVRCVLFTHKQIIFLWQTMQQVDHVSIQILLFSMVMSFISFGPEAWLSAVRTRPSKSHSIFLLFSRTQTIALSLRRNNTNKDSKNEENDTRPRINRIRKCCSVFSVHYCYSWYTPKNEVTRWRFIDVMLHCQLSCGNRKTWSERTNSLSI